MDKLKPVNWVASSLDDLRDLPDDVQDVFGYALQLSHKAESTPPPNRLEASAAPASLKSSKTTEETPIGPFTP